MFLRNQFKCVGMFSLPLVKKQEISLEAVKLIGYDKINQSKDYEKIVHFFLDDYRFESVYNNPEKKIETLKQYKAVLTPDFSMFTEMPIALQLFSTFKNRWVGAYLQEQGISVIPTVRWGDLTSFNFCFDGVEKGSIVAVSTVGVRNEKSHFMLGYNEMLNRIKPSEIICYGKPFEEMKGNIIEVDYGETNNLSKGFFIKKTFITTFEPLHKGGGSASGQSSGNPKPESNDNINVPRYPGNDPTKQPGKDYEWRGKGDPVSGKGAWVNPKTGETLHPDLNHGPPHGPHWDYNYPGGGKGVRIFPDGGISPKYFKGDVLYA